jgi:Transglutaminase elicitor
MPTIAFRDRQEEDQFISYRNEMRRRAINEMHQRAHEAGYAPLDELDDRPENLVDGAIIKHATPKAIEAAGLGASTLSESNTPWPDHYWPIFMGQLGWRYADPHFPGVEYKDWKHRRDYIWKIEDTKIQGNPALASNPDVFSPSEKYDLLVGDRSWGLTRYMWQQGKKIYDDNKGSVQTWMGICEGWAAASYTLGRPTHAVKIKAADETMLTFYPSDIKALASQLWATPRPPSLIRGISRRCNITKPRRDPKTGRIIDGECFDTNPATWHLVVVHQLGVNRRSFVMDASWDYEVWNQPVYAYRIRYFNPQKLGPDQLSPTFNLKPEDLPKGTLEDAIVSRSNFTMDRFGNFRGRAMESVLGVAMEVWFIDEVSPSHNLKEDPKPHYKRVDYWYDLEIDAKDRIFGGEWYQLKHPDFLWTPVPGASFVTDFDGSIAEQWNDPKQSIPASWSIAARTASGTGKPLSHVVESLIRFANM